MPSPDYTLDFDRLRRVGFPEVVLAAGKTAVQIAEICRQLARAHDVLVTRLFPDEWAELAAHALPGRADYDERSRTLHLSVGKPLARVEGDVVLVTAGTADTFVAEEARRTLEYLGVSSTTVPDVGVAGILRLLSRLEEIEKADVVIAVAGMEASLFSVIGGLVGRPLIAVPTSRGYGAALGGVASLLAALNSCANGITAVNIDSGYAAAMAAYRILSGGPRRWDRRRTKGSGTPASTSTPRRSASTGNGRRRSSAAPRRRSK
jgi:NCAIR mutase (PurE)-related protein